MPARSRCRSQIVQHFSGYLHRCSTLDRTYVILVLPKYLLTWGYVKVDAAAFCLQPTTGTAKAPGRWRLDLLNTYLRNVPGETFCLHPDGL